VIVELDIVVYHETIKRDLMKRLIYECRCDERLKSKVERSTLLGYTVLCGGLEHIKIETRFIDYGSRQQGTRFGSEKKP
jgi:hypothetical protein